MEKALVELKREKFAIRVRRRRLAWATSCCQGDGNVTDFFQQLLNGL